MFSFSFPSPPPPRRVLCLRLFLLLLPIRPFSSSTRIMGQLGSLIKGLTLKILRNVQHDMRKDGTELQRDAWGFGLLRAAPSPANAPGRRQACNSRGFRGPCAPVPSV